ncbi:MAG: hypothetical protein AAF547_05710 [Actinomycetota bacterium]
MTAVSDPRSAGDVRPMATTHRNYVSYIDKSREFYAAHGYDRPYRWAANPTAPFAPLPLPLAEATVGVVTTAFRHGDDLPPGAPPMLPKQVYAAKSRPTPTRMFTDDLSWDKQATHTDDVQTYLPLDHLAEAEAAGRIGRLANRFYGVPTEYSRRRSAEDAEAIEAWCREDGVDVVLLIPL